MNFFETVKFLENIKNSNMLKQMLLDFLGNPFDITPLMTAADTLQEQGSPVGEFLAIVLSKMSGNADHKESMQNSNAYFKKKGILTEDGTYYSILTYWNHRMSRKTIFFNGIFFEFLHENRRLTDRTIRRLIEYDELLETLFAAIAGHYRHSKPPEDKSSYVLHKQVFIRIKMLQDHVIQHLRDTVDTEWLWITNIRMQFLVNAFQIIVNQPKVIEQVKDRIPELKRFFPLIEQKINNNCEHYYNGELFNICYTLNHLKKLVKKIQ